MIDIKPLKKLKKPSQTGKPYSSEDLEILIHELGLGKVDNVNLFFNLNPRAIQNRKNRFPSKRNDLDSYLEFFIMLAIQHPGIVDRLLGEFKTEHGLLNPD